ncbi:MAG: PP2C family protein-serine/threonine phosphatase, partial [Carboxydocellales bacterium]
RTVFRAVAKGNLLPHQVLNEVNEILLTDLHSLGSFVTLFYALYDPVTHVLLYANAGHNPPIAFRAATDEFVMLKAKGIYIGGKPEANYSLSSFQLLAGDIVVFYSDGLKEAMNNQREQFGVQRVMDTVRKYAVYDSAGITDCLSYALADFSADAPQRDDITLAILKVQ